MWALLRHISSATHVSREATFEHFGREAAAGHVSREAAAGHVSREANAEHVSREATFARSCGWKPADRSPPETASREAVTARICNYLRLHLLLGVLTPAEHVSREATAGCSPWRQPGDAFPPRTPAPKAATGNALRSPLRGLFICGGRFLRASTRSYVRSPLRGWWFGGVRFLRASTRSYVRSPLRRWWFGGVRFLRASTRSYVRSPLRGWWFGGGGFLRASTRSYVRSPLRGWWSYVRTPLRGLCFGVLPLVQTDDETDQRSTGASAQTAHLCSESADVPDRSSSLNDETSQRIRVLSFVLIVLVVFIHAKLLTQTGATATSLIVAQTVIADGFARAAVPMFFALSGFLFFVNFPPKNGWPGLERRRSETPERLSQVQPSHQELNSFAWIKKLRRRAASLLLPYLLWSAIGLATFFVLQHIPGLEKFFRLPENDVAGMNMIELLHRWLIHPVPGQLWFLRDLCFVTVCSPLLYFAIRRIGWIALLPLCVWWISSGCLPPVSRGVVSSDACLFFAFGAWLAIRNSDVGRAMRGANAVVAVWLLLIAVETGLVLEGRDFSVRHAIVVTGMVSLWSLSGHLPRISERVTSLTFFVFVSHQPMTAMLKKAIGSLQLSPEFLVAGFFALPVFVVAVCVLAGGLLRRFVPSVFSVLNGGR